VFIYATIMHTIADACSDTNDIWNISCLAAARNLVIACMTAYRFFHWGRTFSYLSFLVR